MEVLLNSGNTVFMMLCCVMVLVMTPGLALFYGGLARSRSTLFIMMESFVAVGVVGLVWLYGGFGLAFGTDVGGLIGTAGDYFGLLGEGTPRAALEEAGVPLVLFFLYQLMFCVITVPLMSGAFAERLKMGGFVILLVAFTFAVYVPVCHWVWGGGWLQQRGFVDFAGGAVIHTTAGFGALAAVLALGNRKLAHPGMRPNNLVACAIGTGLLWFGWFGFNAGSALGANELAVTAFANTAIGLASGMVAYCVVAWLLNGRVNFVDVLTGSVAGLATVTPCAGYIQPAVAPLVGVAAGVVCNLALKFTARRGWDDALGVWGVHGMGGFAGCLLIGVLADPAVNGVGASLEQLGVQALGVCTIALGSFVVTFVVVKILRALGFEPTEAQIREGLDEALLNETAYDRGPAPAVAAVPAGQGAPAVAAAAEKPAAVPDPAAVPAEKAAPQPGEGV
jgi:Amt family ammonium transporter